MTYAGGAQATAWPHLLGQSSTPSSRCTVTDEEVSRALPQARHSLEIHERRYGPEYPISLAARNLLANTLSVLGEHKEATEQIQLVLNARQCILGADHPHTTGTRQELAKIQRRMTE
ncbi:MULTISPECIES: tetratricopeptide repeat protein [Streptomyces]|uniref:tetratricopeptide repeat protein n=1 Tax=Streptomyces TaxID=1883 RepID=UPI00099F2BE8